MRIVAHLIAKEDLKMSYSEMNLAISAWTWEAELLNWSAYLSNKAKIASRVLS